MKAEMLFRDGSIRYCYKRSIDQLKIDMSIDQKIQAAIEPILKRISDLQKEAKVMRETIDGMNNGNLSMKNHQNGATHIKPSQHIKALPNRKEESKHLGKPKEEIHIKPAEKLKDNKKTGDQVHANQASGVSVKGKNKKIVEEPKISDKMIKTTPQISQNMEVIQMINIDSKNELDENLLIGIDQNLLKEEELKTDLEAPKQMMNLTEVNSPTQDMMEMKVPETLEIEKHMEMDIEVAMKEAQEVKTEPLEMNNELTNQAMKTEIMETCVNTPNTETIIHEVENKMELVECFAIEKENMNEVQTIENKELNNLCEQELLKDAEPKKEEQPSESKITAPIVQNNVQPVKTEKHNAPKTKPMIHKNQTNPVAAKKVNETHHQNDKTTANKSKIVPSKAIITPIKKQEPVSTKNEKKTPAVVPAKGKIQNKQTKAISVKAKQPTKAVPSKSTMNTPVKATTVPEVKSEMKNSENIILPNEQVKVQMVEVKLAEPISPTDPNSPAEPISPTEVNHIQAMIVANPLISQEGIPKLIES